MTLVRDLLDRLPSRHRDALEWFRGAAGTDVSWPPRLDDGTILATLPKGIYKPAWTEYALSVRETSDSEYANRQSVVGSDNAWVYTYHQEGDDPDYFTNAALLRCLNDNVPVGVMRQVRKETPVRYRVLGIAAVQAWQAGYFSLVGLPNSDDVEVLLPVTGRAIYSGFGVAPSDDPDELQEFARRVRRGQRRFRERLLAMHGERCMIAGHGPAEILEAAHIEPHALTGRNDSANGLLLRADLHLLFDLELLRIDPDTFVVYLSDSLRDTVYWSYNGKRLQAIAGVATERSHLRWRWQTRGS